MLCSSTITSGERAGRDILATIMEIIHAHLACLPCFAAPPPSPPLSPMEGELETLLGGPSDHSLKLTGRLRRANPSATAENALEYDVGTSFELERDGEVGAAQGIGDVRRTGDGDPKEVDEAALRRFMSRLEPGLSMQEIEREEQEETARQERGRASRREAGLTDLAVGNAAAGDGKDEFGTFQSA